MVGREPRDGLDRRRVEEAVDAVESELGMRARGDARLGNDWIYVPFDGPGTIGCLYIPSSCEVIELGSHVGIVDFVWAFERGVDLAGDTRFDRASRLTITAVHDEEASLRGLGDVLRRQVLAEELATLPMVVDDVDLYYSISELRALDDACSFVVTRTGGTNVIEFYSVNDEYGELSNFAAYPIVMGGTRWPTSEHYFQAQKFRDSRARAQIRSAKTPMIAARLGRDRKQKLRKDWESAKDAVMREAVEAKFRQHASLRRLLIETGTAKLVEHTTNDSYWGDGGDGRGKNMLGRILMDLVRRSGTTGTTGTGGTTASVETIVRAALRAAPDKTRRVAEARPVYQRARDGATTPRGRREAAVDDGREVLARAACADFWAPRRFGNGALHAGC